MRALARPVRGLWPLVTLFAPVLVCTAVLAIVEPQGPARALSDAVVVALFFGLLLLVPTLVARLALRRWTGVLAYVAVMAVASVVTVQAFHGSSSSTRPLIFGALIWWSVGATLVAGIAEWLLWRSSGERAEPVPVVQEAWQWWAEWPVSMKLLLVVFVTTFTLVNLIPWD